MKQILEGSQAISKTIALIKPGVVSAYPITPQTHIVEDLAKLKADGEADYEFVRAESEFAAASIVAGASAAGVRTYTATSSQGLLLMNEVIYNIAGMRLPVVMTTANRGVSAPITIWNDHQDAMSVRDAGWIMLFAENHQEAVEQHVIAYRVAEKLRLPAMVNIDGFVLTHTYEPIVLPSPAGLTAFLPAFKPAPGEYLDPERPVTMGAFASPAYYLEIREELHKDLTASQEEINEAYDEYRKIMPEASKPIETEVTVNNGLVEYYGPRQPEAVLIAMGSLVGTIKDAVDEQNGKSGWSKLKVGVLKIKCFRPFPAEDVIHILKNAKYIAVVEKAISLGHAGPLALDVIGALAGKTRAQISDFIVGLGGRDITKEMIAGIIDKAQKLNNEPSFIGK